MKSLKQLINNIKGQLDGIDKMISSDRDCLQVLTQLKAAKSAINSLSNKYLEGKINDCLLDDKKNNHLIKIVKELTKTN